MAIVHGQSEYRICRSIKSNLRIKQEIIARDKGKISIQITSIMSILNDRRFRSFRDFTREFVDVQKRKGKLLNFSLFIIMDVDDCSHEQKQNFISKGMFKDHWLYDYIVPVYNDPNLEATMKAVDIKIESKKDYIIVFPTNHNDLDMDMAKKYCDKLRNCECSNLHKYFDCCIKIAEKNF